MINAWPRASSWLLHLLTTSGAVFSMLAVLAGGRTAVNDHSAADVPWVSESDGAGLLDRLSEHGIVAPE